MTAQFSLLARSFLVMINRKGADRLPDSTFFSCIIPQPRRDCNGGAVIFSMSPGKSLITKNDRPQRRKPERSFFVMTYRKGADRLPDSTLFVYIIPQPRRNCNGGAVVLLATVSWGDVL